MIISRFLKILSFDKFNKNFIKASSDITNFFKKKAYYGVNIFFFIQPKQTKYPKSYTIIQLFNKIYEQFNEWTI